MNSSGNKVIMANTTVLLLERASCYALPYMKGLSKLDKPMKIVTVGATHPWQRALVTALGQKADVAVANPKHLFFGWLPPRLDGDDWPIPRGVLSSKKALWPLEPIIGSFAALHLRLSAGARDAVLLTHPFQWMMARHLKKYFKLVAYHVSDDYLAEPYYANPETEKRLVSACDLFFPVSQSLSALLQKRYDIDQSRITVIPNGVPSDWLESRFERDDVLRSEKLMRIGRDKTLIGIIGVISCRLDLSILKQAHDALENVHWLFVGPVQGDVQGLSELVASDRCTFLGMRPYSELAKWQGILDIALLPFSDSSINPAASPVRVFGHLAFGQPILYTGKCTQLEDFGDLLRHCSSAEELVENIQSLQQANFADGLAEARRAEARKATWAARSQDLLDALSARSF